MTNLIAVGRNARRRRTAKAADHRGQLLPRDVSPNQAVGKGARTSSAVRGRAYDRQLQNRGASLGYRIVEDQPFCWMCDRSSGHRAKEHIFPQWLLERLGASNEQFASTHFDLAGRPISKRGPFPASSLLSGETCDACNHGWMSRLESAFEEVIFRDRDHAWSLAEQEAAAHWFAKTAIAINVSQNYRLLVPADERHAASVGVPPGFEVYLALAKTYRTHLDFKQGWNMGGWVVPTELINRTMQWAERCYRCAIRIDDLIGLVLYAPPAKWLVPEAGFAAIWPHAHQSLLLADLPVVEWTDDFWLRPRAPIGA